MKQPKTDGERVFTLLLTLIVILLLVDSTDLSRLARWIPQVTLAATLLLLILQVLKQTHFTPGDPAPARRNKTGSEEDYEPRAGKRQTLWAILRISVLAPSIWLLGLSAGSAVFCLLHLRWQADESWKFSLIFSAILGLSMYLVFTGILRIPLYPGVIARILV